MEGVSEFLARLALWAADRADVHAVGLAGSWARGTATPDSDVDLILVVDDIRELLHDDGWLAYFGRVVSVSNEDWGLVTARRVRYEDGPDVEFGLTTTTWVALPVDAGTRQVMADGFEIVHDPERLLERCTSAMPESEP